MELDKNQLETLEAYISKFQKQYSKGKYKDLLKEREERLEKFSNYFKKEFLAKMNEHDLGEIVSKLWASQIWFNKEYLVQRILKDNGIEKIRDAFTKLFFGPEDIGIRYGEFIRSVKGLGAASITEMLCYFNPKEYGVWNDKARKALKILKIENIVPINKSHISGLEYKEFNELCKLIAKKLAQAEVPDVDLLMVDFFFYEVWQIGKEKIDEAAIEDNKDFDHNEIRDFIRDIGIWLGFEAETEKNIAKGAKVDVIWQAKIANLGVVTYVFEVQKSGSIDGLILNLQKAMANPTVQKIIAVSDVAQLEKIKQESSALPENFRKALGFWDAFEVKEIHEKLNDVVSSIEKLKLVRSEFEQ